MVPLVVVVESVWVLSRSFKLDRGAIVGQLEAVLASRDVVVERRDLLLRALARYAASRADFADFIILEVALEHGATRVVTFDAALHKHPEFAAP